jgi:SAM-dependent methyltransferase
MQTSDAAVRRRNSMTAYQNLCQGYGKRRLATFTGFGHIEIVEEKERKSASADTAWGHSSLDVTLVQIGNTGASSDLESVRAHKLAIFEAINAKLKVAKSETVLEIGPGLGIHTAILSENARFVYAVDVSDGFLEYFERFCGSRPNVTRIVSHFFPMMDTIPDASIDCGLGLAVFCHMHVYDVYCYIEEIACKLKTGGRFFLNFQNADNGSFDGHFGQSIATYKKGGAFVPIHVAQMQYHSREFFRSVGKKFGLTIEHELTRGGYTEMIFAKS